MIPKICIGLGYGDEGKGLTTSFLCSQTENPIVVRFNGGHQAGHTVVYNDHRHVFSGFGSGTLQGVPTYWSEYCTFYPNSFLREYNMLTKTVKPKIYVHPLCPVTTPFDIDYNRHIAQSNNHGSVGMGFGATIQRQENYYKLFVQDLYHETVLKQKLKNIVNYYNTKVGMVFTQVEIDFEIDFFLGTAKKVTEIIQLADNNVLLNFNPIFEGAQGVLLDMDFGFFPNVTRSNTTTKNAIEIIKDAEPKYALLQTEIYYVTRSYLTRHGNGFMPDEKKLDLKNNSLETNKSHEYQGEFRTAELNIELLNYALECDKNYSKGIQKNLVITCLDQYDINVLQLIKKLNTRFHKVYVSEGNSLTNIKQAI